MKLSDIPLIDQQELGTPNNKPVFGKYSITGTADTLEFIKYWQEEGKKPFYGYYRITESPISRRVTESLKSCYGVRHALLYASVNVAFYEWIRYWNYISGQAPCLLVDNFSRWHWASQIVSVLEGDLLDLRSHEVHFQVQENQPVIFAYEKMTPQIQECIRQAQGSAASVAYMTNDLEHLASVSQNADFSIVDLKDEQSKVLGGVILSSVDLPMEVLAKRRAEIGCVIAPRNSDFLTQQSARCTDSDELSLQKKLCQLEDAKYGALFCTGMQALFAGLEVLKTKQKKTIYCCWYPI